PAKASWLVRVHPAEYLHLDLRAHELLRDVPLHDVSVVDLPGGGTGRRPAEPRREGPLRPSASSRALVWLGPHADARGRVARVAPLRPRPACVRGRSGHSRGPVRPRVPVSTRGAAGDTQCDRARLRVHGSRTDRGRLPPVLGHLRAPRLLDHAALPDGDRAFPALHRLSGDAAADPPGLARRVRSLPRKVRPAMTQTAIPNEPPDFSLVLGGPLYQLFRRAHLTGDALQLLRRRVLVLAG